jgi:hypothetical protein
VRSQHLDLHHQREQRRIDRDHAELRLAEQPQAAPDRDAEAEIQHHDLGSLAGDRLEAGEHDVAAVEGRIGNRLKNPMTGPAHHRARAALDDPTPGCSGWTPINHRISTLIPICTAGPAKLIAARSQRFSGRVGHERRIAGEEVERDLGAGTGGTRRDRVPEFVEERQRGDERRQPQPEVGPVGQDHHDHEHEKARADVYGKTEHSERWPRFHLQEPTQMETASHR